uniref:Uncharacterized protein n=1 Tax=Romanomermis culicivorax TaxID=13658 RepID=A0A915IVW7_ROMCU
MVAVLDGNNFVNDDPNLKTATSILAVCDQFTKFCRDNDIVQSEYFLNNGLTHLNASDDDGLTALQLTSAYNHLELRENSEFGMNRLNSDFGVKRLNSDFGVKRSKLQLLCKAPKFRIRCESPEFRFCCKAPKYRFWCETLQFWLWCKALQIATLM